MSRSLYSTFGFRKILRPINLKIESQGMFVTLKNILKKCSRGFEIKLPETTEKTLKKERVLLICNHPAQADVLMLLAAIPPRKNAFLVVTHGLMSILPAINKHLIPVYISRYMKGNPKVDWKYRLLKKIHDIAEYSPEEARQKNMQSLDLAAKRIDNGSLVGIFPTGGAESRNFYPGVGNIIKNLKNREKTNIVMAHVSGTSSWDFFRIIPLLNKAFPKLKIQFSNPLKASNFTGENGRVIAQKLQEAYVRWLNRYKLAKTF